MNEIFKLIKDVYSDGNLFEFEKVIQKPKELKNCSTQDNYNWHIQNWGSGTDAYSTTLEIDEKNGDAKYTFWTEDSGSEKSY